MISLSFKHKNLVWSAVLAVLFLFALGAPLNPVQAAELNWTDTALYEVVDGDGRSNGTVGGGIHIGLENFGEDIVFAESTDYVGDGMITVTNLPEGLVCRLERLDDTHVIAYFDGQAVAHQAADSVDNVTIRFNASAFEPEPEGMENNRRTDIEIIFIDDPGDEAAEYDGILTWSETTFDEAAGDDGSIGNVIDIELFLLAAGFQGFEQSDDMLADGMAMVNNLPAGLYCSIVPGSRTHCTITLTGSADQHAAGDSITDLEIIFLDTAFTNGDADRVQNSTRNDLEIAFVDGVVEPEPDVAILATFTVDETVYYVNGVPGQMDVAPFAESGRTFVPVRYLAYCLGMNDSDVVWNPAEQTATLTEDGFAVILQIGNPSMNVDGEPRLMDVAPQARSNRIFLPARFVVEAFGGTVEWNGETQTVTVHRNL